MASQIIRDLDEIKRRQHQEKEKEIRNKGKKLEKRFYFSEKGNQERLQRMRWMSSLSFGISCVGI